MKGVFKCAMEDDERRSRSVKRSSLGIHPCIPNKYSRRLKCLSLGMPPPIPFSINNHQFVSLVNITYPGPYPHYCFHAHLLFCFYFQLLSLSFVNNNTGEIDNLFELRWEQSYLCLCAGPRQLSR